MATDPLLFVIYALCAVALLLLSYLAYSIVGEMVRDALHGTARKRREARQGLCGVTMIAGSIAAAAGAVTMIGVASPVWAAAGAALFVVGSLAALLTFCAGLAW